MSMQCLRSSIDAREFEMRLCVLRNSRTRLDASDLAEIGSIRTRIDECDQIARIIISSMHVDAPAQCVASSAENARLALDLFATARRELWDTSTENDGTIDAWGWHPDSDSESEMTWRVRIAISARIA